MTMPQQRLTAFLRAGQLISDIVKTGGNPEKWGAQLPERLLYAAKAALRFYPSFDEIERAAREQRSMHTWMAREIRGPLAKDVICGRLIDACAEIDAEPASNNVTSDCNAYMNQWLFTEHPALGYREPMDFLDASTDLEMLIELFKSETVASRKARRVFASEPEAYRWLREFNRSLEGIPLEMLGSETGRRKVADELNRLATRYGKAK
ncbi:Y4oB family protein [Variovorax sp. dw_308]|uniref:Y4oB family protein n=1 Tax=Variovorax sp. dw_308 TaxID=2721546 RepID=UPI001C444B9D|nr:Y4oB family protein [Variovorax sp. dw_308]